MLLIITPVNLLSSSTTFFGGGGYMFCILCGTLPSLRDCFGCYKVLTGKCWYSTFIQLSQVPRPFQLIWTTIVSHLTWHYITKNKHAYDCASCSAVLLRKQVCHLQYSKSAFHFQSHICICYVVYLYSFIMKWGLMYHMCIIYYC